MPLIVNLRRLKKADVILSGELPLSELDLETHDKVIHATEPLRYELDVQLVDDSLLVRGSLRIALECQCVRCLKPFQQELALDPWTCLLPLQGEEPVAISNDCADLTPHVREDILLELPRHPLCKPECQGLEKPKVGKARKIGGKDDSIPSAWAELDKLKL